MSTKLLLTIFCYALYVKEDLIIKINIIHALYTEYPVIYTVSTLCTLYSVHNKCRYKKIKKYRFCKRTLSSEFDFWMLKVLSRFESTFVKFHFSLFVKYWKLSLANRHQQRHSNIFFKLMSYEPM
jgi:hypothetical protein